MAGKVFSAEADVRRWLEAQGWGAVWWFENASGGTFGFPDAMVACDGRATFIELKLAHFEAQGLVAEVRNAQKINIRKLRAAGMVARFMAGVAGTRSVVHWEHDAMVALGGTTGQKVQMKSKYLVTKFEEVREGFDVYKSG